jgi:Tol biopolymer transport system component/DNA-binding winged helix-turn-helix (wHTH) protein
MTLHRNFKSFACEATMNRDLATFGPFRLNATQGVLTRGDVPVNLPPKVFALLCLLAEQRGGVVTKSVLMETLWPESYVGESSLTQNIFLLRKSLGQTEDGREYVETLSKRGYRLAVPVEYRQEVIDSPPSGAKPDATRSEMAVESQSQALDQVHTREIEASDIRTNERFAILLPIRSMVRRRRRILIALASFGVLLTIAGYSLGKQLFTWQKPSVLRSRRLTNDGAYKEHWAPLILDGSHVFFSEDVDTTSNLAEVPMEGGETTHHKVPGAGSTAFSYSRSDNEILFGSLWESTPEHPLFAQSLPEGAVHSISGLSAHAASWSPDGKKIVFAKGMSVYAADSKGSNVRELAQMKETPYWPRWSPDGRRIRFSSQARNEEASLWEVEETGENLHPLFSSEPWSKQTCCGDWSPDGRYYVFVVDDGRRSSLWTAPDAPLRWRSSAPVELLNGPADFWRSPVIAPDGKHMFALGEHARGRLLKHNPQSHKFEPFLNGLSTDTLSFSRDGEWVAYTAYPEGTLWRCRSDGSERLRLTDAPKVARFPQWSPDGSQISYITAESVGQWKIYTVPKNGGASRQLVHDGSSQGAATWSPDGNKIAFGQIVGFGVNNRTENIRILDLPTGKLMDIPDSEGLWTARWSPDGRYIAAVTADNSKLMLYDFQSEQWKQLANVGTNDVVWSRDGQEISFDSTNEPTIYHINLKDQMLRKGPTLEGLRRTGFYGWSLNIAPDDNPVLLEEAGINEVYSLDVHFP